MLELNIEKEISRATANREIAKRKCDLLRKAGKTLSDDDYKYWVDRQILWNNYLGELTSLSEKYAVVKLGKTVFANGFHIAITADDKTVKNFSHKKLPQDVLENIPIWKDNRGDNPPCARCGIYGTELHHWAPRHLFDDCDDWPTAYLCPSCHQLWHNKIQQHSRYNNGH